MSLKERIFNAEERLATIRRQIKHACYKSNISAIILLEDKELDLEDEIEELNSQLDSSFLAEKDKQTKNAKAIEEILAKADDIVRTVMQKRTR